VHLIRLADFYFFFIISFNSKGAWSSFSAATLARRVYCIGCITKAASCFSVPARITSIALYARKFRVGFVRADEPLVVTEADSAMSTAQEVLEVKEAVV
jgi:hypothetical protein